jgi:3-hydroxyisobutyrate dehydrogenase-like beta-hydroxyacid dehydrogenase
MEKDLGLAVDIAAKTKCRVPLGSNAHQLYGMLSDHGYVSVLLSISSLLLRY